MRKIILLMFAVSPLALFAQKRGGMEVMPSMTNGFGISFQDFDGLNSRVANLPQYRQLKDYMGTLQMGMTKSSHNFISAGTLTAGSSLSGDRDRRSSNLRLLGAAIDLGYDVIPSEKVMLFPLIGIGAENYRAKFYTDNSAVSFNDVLTSNTVQNNIRPVSFTSTFFTYRAGLGFAVKTGKKMDGSIGLRAGYTGSFKDKAWKSSDRQSLANAPVDNISRFYVSLVFGHDAMGYKK